MREAIVLAGGLGTRLQSVVKDLPKPMADVGGRPFLAYVLDQLTGQGVDRVLLSVGYRHQSIADYFHTQHNGASLEFVVEPSPLGTGGALLEALRRVQGERALVVNGDTYFAVDLGALERYHLERAADLTLCVKPLRNFDRYGTVLSAEGRVAGFREKAPAVEGDINGGVYVVEKRLEQPLSQLALPFSFERDFLEPNLRTLRAFAFVSDGYFIDIGIPEDYARAQTELPGLPT